MCVNPSKLRMDIPEFSRCCFCLPLRQGLLAWGYFKLVILSFLLLEFISDLKHWEHSSTLIVLTIIVVIDFVFNFIFLIAGHLKHHRLFVFFYHYSLVVLNGYLLYGLWSICSFVYGYFSYNYVMVNVVILFEIISTIIIHIYVTLLVRSEANKLSKNLKSELNVEDATCSQDVTAYNVTVPIE